MRKKLFFNNSSYSSLMKKFRILGLFLICLIAFPMFANPSALDVSDNDVNEAKFQQNITGIVSDESGPIPGVSVQVKGSSTGTVTDFDGKYTIKADSDAVLVFSYIGYKNQEVSVNGKSILNVNLEVDVSSLDEVVVVGYTSKKRGDVTGSISTLKAEAIESTANKDVAKSLAGKVSGLIVADRGGYPGSTDGADLTLLIRGASTLGNNSPLILIDGIASGSFQQLAPQDIESLSVLKDGAAAIYGNRAANGVVLITTKRGKSGKPKVKFSTQYSVSQFSAFPNQMSSEQYAIYENEITERKNIGLAVADQQALRFSQSDIQKYADGSDPINFPNTNWADLTFADSAPEARHSISISGGNENVKYFVSGDVLTQEGNYKSGDLNFEQYQLRSNIDIKLTEDFKLGVDLTGRIGETNEPGVDRANIYKHIYTNEPVLVGEYPNGLPGFGGENGQNPLIMSSNASGFVNRITHNYRTRLSYDWKLDKFIEGLSVRGYAGLSQTSFENKSWDKPWSYYQLLNGEYVESQGYQVSPDRVLRETFNKSNQRLLNSTLHYATTFGENHSFNSFVGYENSLTSNRNFFGQRTGFLVDSITELDLGNGDQQTNGGESEDFSFVSYFASISYDYDKKYFVDLTVRRDGSSRFADGRNFGTFPSVALSWAIGKESFMENVNWVNDLKIRSSFSQMGNDRIQQFQYLNSYNSGYPSNTQGNGWEQPNGYVFGTPGVATTGYGRAQVPNELVTWEVANMMNIGLNYSLFDSRLTGDFNYFLQNRSNILASRDAVIPDAAGLTNLPDENFGEVKSFGWEFELAWRDKVGEVDYNVGFNFTKAQNEVINLGEAESVPEWRTQEGRQLNSYVVFPTNGIFKDQAQVDATAVKKPGTVEGEPIYVDTDGSGTIDANDRIRVNSSSVPQIQYGIFGGMNYKNWNFNLLFQGQAEADALVFFDQSGSKPDFVFNDRWTPDNRNASYPRAFAQGDTYSGEQRSEQGGVNSGFEGADIYLKDASFLRLKEIELGYTLTKDVTKFADVKLSLRGFNLLTMFSDIYDLGLDPEASGYNNFRNSVYPSLKSFTLGVNINF